MNDKCFSGIAIINHEAAFLSAMLTWAANYFPGAKINTNPLIGLKRFEENKNERYVAHEEYASQLSMVKDHQYLPECFEIAYLCACRSIEVRHLNLSDELPEGLRIRRRKGSKDNIIKWSPRLKAAVESAKQKRVKKKVTVNNQEQPLITNTLGERISKTALNSAMQDLKKISDPKVFWSMHLLKHKEMTDAKNKNIGGHVTEQMRNLYDHSLPVIDAADQ